MVAGNIDKVIVRSGETAREMERTYIPWIMFVQNPNNVVDALYSVLKMYLIQLVP